MSSSVGFFSVDTWSMVTTWTRNTLLIQTTVVLAIACALAQASHAPDVVTFATSLLTTHPSRADRP